MFKKLYKEYLKNFFLKERGIKTLYTFFYFYLILTFISLSGLFNFINIYEIKYIYFQAMLVIMIYPYYIAFAALNQSVFLNPDEIYLKFKENK